MTNYKDELVSLSLGQITGDDTWNFLTEKSRRVGSSRHRDPKRFRQVVGTKKNGGRRCLGSSGM